MSEAAAFVFLIGRILFALYFLIAGLTFHVRQTKMAEGYAGQAGFPIPAIAGWPTGVWMALGALSVILGVWADLGSLMIGLFVLVAAAYFHRFWAVPDEQKLMQTGFFWRNVIALGGSLALFAVFASVEVPYTLTGPLFDLR